MMQIFMMEKNDINMEKRYPNGASIFEEIKW